MIRITGLGNQWMKIALVAHTVLISMSLWADSTWTGTSSSDMQSPSNWAGGVPTDSTAIFNGNGANSPLSNQDAGPLLTFDQCQFTDDTQVSVITDLSVSGVAGVNVDSDITATFEIYEHHPLEYDPANVTIEAGPAGDGGGTVLYNLKGYGELQTYSGASGPTIINVAMTEGNNYFEVNAAGINTFNNVSSDDSTDEIRIETDATLNIKSSGTNTIDGVISGGGSLTKGNTGTLIITNTNTLSGANEVTGGILILNGTLPGNMTVGADGTLKGTGSVGGDLDVSGTLAPGNSIGTLSSGPVSFDSGSTFVVEMGPSAATLLDVTGTATLDGTISITQNSGTYAQSGQYTIIRTTGGISGSFDTVSITALPNFNLSLSQGSHNLLLNYQFNIPISTTNNLSGNSLILANYFNANGTTEMVSELGNLSGSALEEALEALSPSRNAFGSYVGIQTAFSLGGQLASHLDCYRFAPRRSDRAHFMASLIADTSETPPPPPFVDHQWTLWVAGYGNYAHLSAIDQNPSFNMSSGAVLIGCDHAWENRNVVGGALSYVRSHFDEDQDMGKGNINSYLLALYGNVFAGHFYFSPALWGALNQTDNTRNISFPGFSKKASADITDWQLIPHLEVGYEWGYSWCSIVPFTALDWAISWQKGYTETGASPFNASQTANNSSMVRSETGLKFGQEWERNWGIFSLREKVSYVFEKPFGVGTVQTSFVGAPGSFTVVAVDQVLNLGALGLDFIFFLEKDRSLMVDLSYGGEFGANYWSNALKLTVSKRF
ncbi:MAG: autotransporter domain-containing protein [Simkaniaceae bacterium]|nr:autotransporter domain-containing protein [Simkaniaceae bacterium]MCF7852673.1 autotransporter domain-containing protein [Simkaniaceae bacterium]